MIFSPIGYTTSFSPPRRRKKGLAFFIKKILIISSFPGSSYNISSTRLTDLTSISNGLCRFNPTSKKGKWIFLAQVYFF